MRCGTTEKVAIELSARDCGFMPLSSVALRSGASLF